MASTGFEPAGQRLEIRSSSSDEKHSDDKRTESRGVGDAPPRYSPGEDAEGEKAVADSTRRNLKPRHIQLIGIGG